MEPHRPPPAQFPAKSASANQSDLSDSRQSKATAAQNQVAAAEGKLGSLQAKLSADIRRLNGGERAQATHKSIPVGGVTASRLTAGGGGLPAECRSYAAEVQTARASMVEAEDALRAEQHALTDLAGSLKQSEGAVAELHCKVSALEMDLASQAISGPCPADDERVGASPVRPRPAITSPLCSCLSMPPHDRALQCSACHQALALRGGGDGDSEALAEALQEAQTQLAEARGILQRSQSQFELERTASEAERSGLTRQLQELQTCADVKIRPRTKSEPDSAQARQMSTALSEHAEVLSQQLQSSPAGEIVKQTRNLP